MLIRDNVDPTVYISGLVCQLVALPIGKAFERLLPTTRFNTFGYVWSLNPGPFNIKEHTVITVMANVVSGGIYATDVIVTQQIFFNQRWGFGYQILLCLSTQLIGFSFAGLVRQYLVWPSAMLWPGALVNSALFNTLHKSYGKRETKHISRERFFVLAMTASFVWYWFPGFLFTALSVFNWVCWIAPNNIVVNQLFGYSTGLGMGFLTFDWSMISFTTSPLVVPVSLTSQQHLNHLSLFIVVGASQHDGSFRILLLVYHSDPLLCVVSFGAPFQVSNFFLRQKCFLREIPSDVCLNRLR